MIKVWRRPGENRAYIYDVTEGPADSFSAHAIGDRITIIRKWINIVEVAGVRFSEIMNESGDTFPTLQATMLYLDNCFRTEIPELASAVEKDFVLAEEIPALRMVYASSDDERVSIGDPNDFDTSKVIGMTTAHGMAGERVPVRLFGKLDDQTFSFPVNAVLYLDSFGRVTNTPPAENGGGTSTKIGYALGTGSIFIRTESPIQLSST